MQLPAELQRFSHPILLVAADRVHANLFLITDGVIGPVDMLEHEPERKSDDETSFVNVDTGVGSGPEPSDDARFSAYVRELAKMVQHNLHEQKIRDLRLVMEAELAHRLKKELGGDASIVTKEAHVNAMKEELEEIVRRVI